MVSALPSSLRPEGLLGWAFSGMVAVAAFAVTTGLIGQDIDDFVYSFRRGDA